MLLLGYSFRKQRIMVAWMVIKNLFFGVREQGGKSTQKNMCFLGFILMNIFFKVTFSNAFKGTMRIRKGDMVGCRSGVCWVWSYQGGLVQHREAGPPRHSGAYQRQQQSHTALLKKIRPLHFSGEKVKRIVIEKK